MVFIPAMPTMVDSQYLVSAQENKSVLLAEDNGDDVELIKRKFRSSDLNFRLFVAKDGDEALDYLYHQNKYADKEKFPDPDLIILDIRMPKKNGIEVLREIKSNEELRKIPVVMLTVSTIEKDVIDSFEIGCNHYIAKSIGFERFKDSLELILKHYLMK